MLRTLTLSILACVACMPVAPAQASPTGKPVHLADASARPAASATLKPGAHVAFRTLCRSHPTLAHRFTETSAYAANGGPLGGQHRHGTRLAWHGVRGAVTYDTRSGTFRNGTANSVIVAGWCS